MRDDEVGADLAEDKRPLLQTVANTTLFTDGVPSVAGSKCLSAEI